MTRPFVLAVPLAALIFACDPAPSNDKGADSGWSESDPPDSEPPDETGDDSAAPDDSEEPVDTGEAPEDKDGDGVFTPEDCDDRDPAVAPGAEELFNGVDDDCDGQTDANGAWSGTADLDATATYEGKRYTFALRCPVTMERDTLYAEWEIVCEPDPDDSWAMLLLGERLTITPLDAYCWDLTLWEGAFIVRSSNGWDSEGEGDLRFTSLSRATLRGELRSVYLNLDFGGALNHD
ncbi:hypothetical protein L6R49_20850 [Myxococcota bacterium]|nr:hypothetical protein [Myxococcota bacterium]